MKTRKFIPGALLGIAIIVSASPASAHVTVNPSTAEKGSRAELSFKVPNEKDDASTVKIEITLPTEKPLSSVRAQPHAGWTTAVEKANDVVSRITWTAEPGNGIAPNQFDKFTISTGPLPADVDSLTFKALQTYTNGETVRWIDVATAGQSEPEHPAPTLKLTAGEKTQASSDDHGDHEAAEKTEEADEVTQSDVDSAKNLARISLVFGAAGLGLAGAAFVIKRRS